MNTKKCSGTHRSQKQMKPLLAHILSFRCGKYKENLRLPNRFLARIIKKEQKCLPSEVPIFILSSTKKVLFHHGESFFPPWWKEKIPHIGKNKVIRRLCFSGKSYRFLIGIYATSSSTFLYAGRMMRFPSKFSSSLRCAHQPTIRAMANSGVKISCGKPIISYTKPE